MSGYEAPPPSNLDYFNTLFYYDPTGNGSGGGGSTMPSLNYPVAQGLESFPSGIDMGNPLVFTNANTTLDRIDNVATINFNDNSSQATAYDAAAVGQLGSANTWQAQNTFRTALSVPAGLTFPTGSQTAPYQSNLVGQLSAANTWASVNTFDAGIKFGDGTTQTTAPVTTNLLTSNNTWSGVNTWDEDCAFHAGCTFNSASQVEFDGEASFLNQTVKFENFPLLVSTDICYNTITTDNFITKGYTDGTYASLNSANSFTGSNTFGGPFSVITTDGVGITGSQLNITTTNGTSFTGPMQTQSFTLTNGYNINLGLSGFTCGYDTANYYPTMIFTAPNTDTAGQFIFNFPYQKHYYVINGGGVRYEEQAYTPNGPQAVPEPTSNIVQTQTDVIIGGTSWASTLKTLNYLKTFLLHDQPIPG